MLTIKQIVEDKEAVIRGLEKKNFKAAREAIDQVLAIDNKRKEAQAELDGLNAQVNQLSKSIGGLMKEGKKEEAEAAKRQVADIKARSKELEELMKQAEEEKRALLCTIPNVPYDLVPEGKTAEDNVVVKTGGHDTVLP
ncbi:MAG: serine--tRNA ligase, partial [Bacteroidales bacterium]|nr:serine--tRNA ligase [Bacteroidales bacterium]